ncbi:alpha/beta fold hydrolase [Sphingopyxis flava]|uniref:Pimeloyl-ACP methyl ester carboxylesterase n=1 Tax=Sphingopyxis flava TaxID=1507287 RepID=A0A1T5E9B8_9SPHN|nr:alpha/beta hydrolase [Sphingopyxis flava]SKB80597.1 Pimeloyl-ACP methyl ester carboxylesterase [Sphingopyxis flava]
MPFRASPLATLCRTVALVPALLLAAAAAPAHAQPAQGTAPGAMAVPAKPGAAEVNGVRLHYAVHGDLASDTAPLLILHGAFMSGEAMKPLVDRFTATRPVITLDARGHGRTGDVGGPISYETMADDAAALLAELKVARADVLGYSMGGSTAVALAVRHPDRIGKQVILSGTTSLDGWHPEVLSGIAKMTPEELAGSPMEKAYRAMSPTSEAFPKLVAAIKHLDSTSFGFSDEQIRAIPGKTMIILGDADGVTFDHAIKLFKLRGGGDKKPVVEGFMTEAPKARLAILPGTSHIGVMAEAATIAAMVTPFLDDTTPPLPAEFF